MTITAQLTWEVFVSPLELTVVDGHSGGPAAPAGFDDLPPGVQYETWSPISSTLIAGQRDAVLVDPLNDHDPGTSPRRLDSPHRKEPHRHLRDSRAR